MKDSSVGVKLSDGAFEAALQRPQRGQLSIIWTNFKRNRLAVVGGVIILMFYLGAIMAPVIAPHDYRALNPGASLLSPRSEYLLGTDRQTRDVFSRLVIGSRVSLSVGFAAVAILITIGLVIGATSGFFGGWVDNVLMRFVDVMLAIPLLLLLMLAVALFSPGLWTTVFVIGLTTWPATARLIRGEILALRNREFVLAARTSGATGLRIIARHLLPNAMAVVVVQATLWLSYAIILESSLSFLGLGVQPPEPTWGGMLADGKRNMRQAWWLTLFPGLAIFLTVICFNLVGDGLRDAFDPRQRRR